MLAGSFSIQTNSRQVFNETKAQQKNRKFWMRSFIIPRCASCGLSYFWSGMKHQKGFDSCLKHKLPNKSRKRIRAADNRKDSIFKFQRKLSSLLERILRNVWYTHSSYLKYLIQRLYDVLQNQGTQIYTKFAHNNFCPQTI